MDDVPFKPRAYEKAARSIEALQEDVEDIYRREGIKGLQWIPPELRENTDEIGAAASGTLPNLMKLEDLKGDLQVHSTWTDGSNSISEMAEEAKLLELEYIVISDHSKSLAMTGGLDEKPWHCKERKLTRRTSLLMDFGSSREWKN